MAEEIVIDSPRLWPAPDVRIFEPALSNGFQSVRLARLLLSDERQELARDRAVKSEQAIIIAKDYIARHNDHPVIATGTLISPGPDL